MTQREHTHTHTHTPDIRSELVVSSIFLFHFLKKDLIMIFLFSSLGSGDFQNMSIELE